MVLGNGNTIHPECAAYCHKEFWQKLKAVVAWQLGRDIVIGDTVLEEDVSNCGGGCSGNRCRLSEYNVVVSH